MHSEFERVVVDARLRQDTIRLSHLGIAEDLGEGIDWTSRATLAADRVGQCDLVARQGGVASGLVAVEWILQALEVSVDFSPSCIDGQRFTAGQRLGTLTGGVRDLLTAERLVLNIVSRLCGVATLTSQYVSQIAGSNARLYDTRKTTTGWRRLEKYAVGCGGGYNHRGGLYDAFLIKDNHLALGGENGRALPPSEAVRRARAMAGQRVNGRLAPRIVEIEVDSLDQLRDVLPASPDIILVDNFPLDQLSQAVRIRDATGPGVILEASGGVTMDRIAQIAATGVDRISCGALTHQATWLDVGLDWQSGDAS